MEKVNYLGQPDCYKLSNEAVELIVTTNTGPRIVRYAFRDGENILGEVPDTVIKTDLGEWKPLGGHRLWAAPESSPRSYAPDNEPVAFEVEGNNAIRLTQKTEAGTGLQKEMTIELDAEGTCVQVHHKITNRSLWAIELSPWALTIMRGGGEVIIPQEPYRAHSEYLLPARPLVLWHYTNLSDQRWTLGTKYIRLRTDERLAEPQKIGVSNKQGWAAYRLGQTLFVKRADFTEGAPYPDYGCNFETFTAGTFIELESLAPLSRLEPGAAATHTERWFLFHTEVPDTTEDGEDGLEAILTSLLTQTR
ncbi:MAG TPA: hypothetical protein VJT09_10140 [Pyrinomonadaceae bacterium]|nr:hypothetical protein [Pyrinomonadaceae bacterium]